mmetsp:Transcript_13823/g.39313  ORF Transcript_13823/g.39313 Transcript_13823/m.39313 type:complete len:110 (-) Transcript_13823:5-334(-)
MIPSLIKPTVPADIKAGCHVKKTHSPGLTSTGKRSAMTDTTTAVWQRFARENNVAGSSAGVACIVFRTNDVYVILTLYAVSIRSLRTPFPLHPLRLEFHVLLLLNLLYV